MRSLSSIRWFCCTLFLLQLFSGSPRSVRADEDANIEKKARARRKRELAELKTRVYNLDKLARERSMANKVGYRAMHTRPVYEPGLTDIDVSPGGLVLTLGFTHAIGLLGDAKYELRRGPTVVDTGILPTETERDPYAWTYDYQDSRFVIGGIRLDNHRVGPMGKSGMRSGLQIPTEDPLDPGPYELHVTLQYQDEYQDVNGSAPAETVEISHPFEVKKVPSPSGGTITNPPEALPSHAAIRRERRHPYWYLATASTENGSHDEDIGLSSFWVTLPMSIAQRSSRVDFLWYHDGKLAGRAKQEGLVGGSFDHDPLTIASRFWGWPGEFTYSELMTQSGRWQVHVVQDGQYRTTCTFTVESGQIQGGQEYSTLIPCSPQSEAKALARQLNLGKKHHGPDRELAKEALALSRSQELRTLRGKIIQLEHSRGLESLSAVAAREDQDWAFTRRQERRAVENERAANRSRRDIEGDLGRLEKRYRDLVNRFSK